AQPPSISALFPYPTLFGAVHGGAGQDPTEPPRSGPFPYPPVPHEPDIDVLAGLLGGQGLRPFYLPMGIDLRPGGRCIRCKTCDGDRKSTRLNSSHVKIAYA